MPILDLPPNPASTPEDTADQPARIVLRTGRYGEMEHHELVRLLDTLDDDRARSRFRESIYVSILVYMAVAWFIFYGPRVLFHQPRVIDPIAAMKQHDKELTMLDTPSDLARQLRSRPTPKPTLDRKTLDQLKAMNRPAPRPQPAPAPLPPTPAPQTNPQVKSQPTPLPAAPAPPVQQPKLALAPTPQPVIPDSPRPSPTRPNFSQPNETAGDAIREAARNAARAGNSGADTVPAPSSSRGSANAGLEALSDLQGIDFEAYFRRLKREIYNSWIPLIPEEARPPLNKRGITQIRFTISPDGRVSAMHLDGSTHDTAIDRAAWGSITGIGQFQPLPSGFHGPLELRFTYYVNEQPQ